MMTVHYDEIRATLLHRFQQNSLRALAQ
uniref:Uncharacterized protein n=1 Tax=Rhizophora mucronata TaxID=61149 RepID=A0A2P2R0M4_RHIMU